MPKPTYATLQAQLLDTRQRLYAALTDPAWGVSSAEALPFILEQEGPRAAYMVAVCFETIPPAGIAKRLAHTRHAACVARARWDDTTLLLFVSKGPITLCGNLSASLNKSHTPATVGWAPYTGDILAALRECRRNPHA